MFIDDSLIDSPYLFTDEPYFSAVEKWQVLRDWQRFIRSGFKKLFFTEALYQHLQRNCAFMAHHSRERFWTYYFAAEVAHLRAFVNQFGGHQASAEHGPETWLDGPAVDLKSAMCQEMTLIYEPVLQVLDDLERQYNDLIQAWHEFALAADLGDVTLPLPYTLSRNSRSLLAFVIQVALEMKQPLTGLQLHIPMPLLYPETQV